MYESNNYSLNGQPVGLVLPPPMVDPDDPLLIAQTLTYVTDDGSVLLSFTSAPFSFGELALDGRVDRFFANPLSLLLSFLNAIFGIGRFLHYTISQTTIPINQIRTIYVPNPPSNKNH